MLPNNGEINVRRIRKVTPTCDEYVLAVMWTNAPDSWDLQTILIL